MNMIEKVAKAIYETRNGKGCTPWAKRGMVHKAPYFADARAAIEAMREPEAEMLGHGDDAIFYSDFDHRANACWKAMIEAALSEEKAE